MPLSSGTIKFISSLRQKKVRRNYHLFTAEGGRIVTELLNQDRYRIDHVYALAEWAETVADSTSVPLTIVSPKELGRMSQLTTPNQVLAVVEQPEANPELPREMASGWSMFLDGIQSPSNLGALLRIADWFGFQHVIGGPGTADLYNSKSIQASMGSFLRVSYHEDSLENVQTAFPELPLHGADLNGENIYDYTAPRSGVLVLGAEGPGLSTVARAQVQRWLTIPRSPGREAESLNAAVAAGILCGAIAHQRG